jgi:hypothetical protein
VNPNGHDQVSVGGNTFINPAGSVLALQVFNGFTSPARGNTFKFISGPVGSISGHFGSITSNFTTDLLIDVSTGEAFGTGAPVGSNLAVNFPGTNGSQQALLSSLELGSGPGLTDHQFAGGDLIKLLLTNPASSSAQIINQASPEAYAGLADYALHTTRSYLDSALTLDPVVSAGNMEVFAGYNHLNTGSDSSQSQADYTLDSNGGLLGFRGVVNKQVTAGFFAGYDTGSAKSTYLNSSITGEVAGVYATLDPLTSHRLLGIASFTYGNYKTHGTRSTFSGTSSFDGVSSADYLGKIGVQYVAIQQAKYSITPEINLAYSSSSVDAFTETNASTLEALQVNGQHTPSFRTEAAVNAMFVVNSKFDLTARVGVGHDFENAHRDVTANVVSETTSMTVRAPGMGDTDYTIGIGAIYDVTKQLRLQASIQAGFSSDAKISNSVTVGGSYSW